MILCIFILINFSWCGFCSGSYGIVVLAAFICPLVDEAKRRMQASWWEGLTVGETGSCSGGQCSVKTSIWLSADGWGYAPFLLVAWLEAVQPQSLCALRRVNGVLQEGSCLGVPPRTADASAPIPVARHCWLMPPQETLQHWQVGLVQSPVGSLLLFPGSWCALDQGMFVPSKNGVSVFTSPVIKSSWPSRLYSLGIFVLLMDLQAVKPDVGLRNFITVGELLWYYYSLVCGSSTLWVWDLVLSWLQLLLCLWMWGLFSFGGFQHPLVNGCSTASCNFGALSRGDEHTFFHHLEPTLPVSLNAVSAFN